MGRDMAGAFDNIMQAVLKEDVRGEGRTWVAKAIITEFDQMGWDTQGECETRSDPWIDKAFEGTGHVREAEAEVSGVDPSDGQRSGSAVPAGGAANVRRRPRQR